MILNLEDQFETYRRRLTILITPLVKNHCKWHYALEFVRVHGYKDVRCVIMHRMVGKAAFRFTFARKDKDRTVGETSAATIAPNWTIDSGLLFERFLVVAKT